MKWILTKHLLTPKRTLKYGNVKKLADISDPIPFVLTDGDKEPYFLGYLSLSGLNNADGDTAFAPLDEFGRAYGCTDIKYKDPETGWQWL